MKIPVEVIENIKTGKLTMEVKNNYILNPTKVYTIISKQAPNKVGDNLIWKAEVEV